MVIKFSKTFTMQRAKASKKIQEVLDERIKLFIDNPQNQLLNFHKLKGVLKDYHSINITGDWRAIIKIDYNKKTAIFLLLGAHSELYK